MAESNGVKTSHRPRHSGCRLALIQLVRKLRRQSKMLCTAAGGARPDASRCRQYDALSYARNFDGSGFGGVASDGHDVSGDLYHYTFASRFVLASSARQPQ